MTNWNCLVSWTEKSINMNVKVKRRDGLLSSRVNVNVKRRDGLLSSRVERETSRWSVVVACCSRKGSILTVEMRLVPQPLLCETLTWRSVTPAKVQCNTEKKTRENNGEEGIEPPRPRLGGSGQRTFFLSALPTTQTYCSDNVWQES